MPVHSVRAKLPRPTMLEVLAILLAIAIVLTFVSPRRFRARRDAPALVRSDMDVLEAALETYWFDTGTYPTTAQGLAALVRMPTAPRPWNWRGPYVVGAIPTDPWGHPYVYRRVDGAGSDTYVLSSNGADGEPGGKGDAADVTVRR